MASVTTWGVFLRRPIEGLSPPTDEFSPVSLLLGTGDSTEPFSGRGASNVSAFFLLNYMRHQKEVLGGG